MEGQLYQLTHLKPRELTLYQRKNKAPTKYVLGKDIRSLTNENWE